MKLKFKRTLEAVKNAEIDRSSSDVIDIFERLSEESFKIY